MKNRLYATLEKFAKEGLSKEERQSIFESDNKENLQSNVSNVTNRNFPQIFEDIAINIVNGYFLVSDNSGKNSFKVYPTCVEIYYHEEAEDGIKDPIVYHRNTKNNPKDIFKLGILHNHVSGIDITFEHIVNGQFVRASALIREFRAEGIEKFKDGDDRSTNIYEALFSQFNIFDGFSIEWHDEPEIKNSVKADVRKNVAKYMTDNKTKMPAQEGLLNTKNKKYVQCQRLWQFKIS